MSTDAVAQTSSKPPKQTMQSWNCVCCHNENATGHDTTPVSNVVIGYGIIESIISSSPSNISPLQYLTTDDRFNGFVSANIGALIQCITTLTRLDSRVLYENKLLEFFQSDSFENFNSEEYYKEDLNAIKTKVNNAKELFYGAILEFEEAELNFLEAFCLSVPENVEYRRCRVKTNCPVAI
jgi:hypothetical protein